MRNIGRDNYCDDPFLNCHGENNNYTLEHHICYIHDTKTQIIEGHYETITLTTLKPVFLAYRHKNTP